MKVTGLLGVSRIVDKLLNQPEPESNITNVDESVDIKTPDNISNESAAAPENLMSPLLGDEFANQSLEISPGKNNESPELNTEEESNESPVVNTVKGVGEENLNVNTVEGESNESPVVNTEEESNESPVVNTVEGVGEENFNVNTEKDEGNKNLQAGGFYKRFFKSKKNNRKSVML
jgi:HSP20 family molecular chaperone IbpA